jgi:uncharacterized protein YndB with AHSA1/START domain
MTLADGGARLLIADAALAQWVELRSVGAVSTAVRPGVDDDRRITSVDAIAAAHDGVFVLDRAAGLVHRVQRDGRIVATLGAGELKRPVALAVDRFDRVFVVDAQDRAIKVLREGDTTLTLAAAELGVQQIGGMAVDEQMLAVADTLVGQVRLFRLRDGARR